MLTSILNSKTFFAFLLFLSLTACGGGGGGEANEQEIQVGEIDNAGNADTADNADNADNADSVESLPPQSAFIESFTKTSTTSLSWVVSEVRSCVLSNDQNDTVREFWR